MGKYSKLFSFRSGKKLLIQQQELEKRTREYNDYHNKLIQEKQLNLSPDNGLKNGGDKSSLTWHDQNHTSAPTTISRNASFVQSSGKSRLEITSREVSVNTSNNLILNSAHETITLILHIHFQVNGRLVLEGVLRICWGVEHSIRIKEFDDKRLIAKRSFKGKCDNRFHLITSKFIENP